MLLFEFDRALLRFKLNTPALAPLFQLPPAIGKRNSLFPKFETASFTAVAFRRLGDLLYPTSGHLAYLREVVTHLIEPLLVDAAFLVGSFHIEFGILDLLVEFVQFLED